MGFSFKESNRVWSLQRILKGTLFWWKAWTMVTVTEPIPQMAIEGKKSFIFIRNTTVGFQKNPLFFIDSFSKSFKKIVFF
jgi:hypothetical protein